MIDEDELDALHDLIHTLVGVIEELSFTHSGMSPRMARLIERAKDVADGKIKAAAEPAPSR